jgi:hypothetical protein
LTGGFAFGLRSISGVSASAASMVAGAVATRKHRCETAREVNPFPLIEVAVQLPERGKRVRQAFDEWLLRLSSPPKYR